MSRKEIELAINNAERSLNMEGFVVSNQIKELGAKLLTKEITMDEYIAFVKQKAGVKS